ncbi:MAG: hypothetical protein EP343_32190 [Deltaproteobacteria bacterium]|nr:MAG: hypothetical protein EP343_32190 [Deltaproteobacteria bacterium]
MNYRDQIIELWTEDAAFRSSFRQNPVQALSNAGIVLSKEEQAALQELDFGASDMELSQRINPLGKNC